MNETVKSQWMSPSVKGDFTSTYMGLASKWSSEADTHRTDSDAYWKGCRFSGNQMCSWVYECV